VERALDAALAPQAPAALGLAMRYAVLDGGKRLRRQGSVQRALHFDSLVGSGAGRIRL